MAIMRVTIINKHLQDIIGGSELQCDFLATGLEDRGHKVTYIAPGGGKNGYQTSYTVIPCRNTGDEIAKKIEESEPDIIYWRYNKIEFLKVMRQVARRPVPILFAASSVNDVNPSFIDGYLRIDKKLKQLYRSYLNHLGMHYVSGVTVNNKDYLGKLPVSEQRFIPNGMKTDTVPFEWSAPYCVWVSSIKEKKRPELVVKLASELESKGVDILMIGSVQSLAYDWIENPSKLPGNLHYLGQKSPVEVNGILNEALLHIHTCLPEGFPNVFIQAWMQGCPSVSFGFDPGGYLTDELLGYNCDENWSMFVSRVKELINDEKKRRQFGVNAKRFAESMFSKENFIGNVERFMQDLIDNQQRADDGN